MILNNFKMASVVLVGTLFFISTTSLAEDESCRTVRFCLIDLPIVGIGCIKSGCEAKEPKEPKEPKDDWDKPPRAKDFLSVPNKI